MIVAGGTRGRHVSARAASPAARAHGSIGDHADDVAAELAVAAPDAHRLDVNGVQHWRDHGIVA